MFDYRAANNLLIHCCRYKNVEVVDFTSSWQDGLAFNAVIHSYQ